MDKWIGGVNPLWNSGTFHGVDILALPIDIIYSDIINIYEGKPLDSLKDNAGLTNKELIEYSLSCHLSKRAK